jgi:beta-glucosidase/6-phospho-beta-glucosidase/beta-galactosidase
MKNIFKWLIGLVAVGVIAGVIVAVVLVFTSNNDKDFPPDFTFGAASSSYQIEGAWDADGKTPNIWDTAVHNNPDMIALRGNGDVAANSYNLYKQDVAEMKKIGVSCSHVI